VAGSSVPLADVRTPRAGAGADFIIKASRPFTGAKRLRLLVIGAATEAASALLKDPTLASRVEIVGMGFKNWPEGGNEFNIKNDIRAWQVILDSEAPVTVGDAAVCIKDLVVNAAKAEALLGGRGKPGRFLADLLINQVKASPEGVASVTGDRTAWPVWDEVTIAHVLGMTRSEVRPRPRLGDDFKFVIPEKPGGRTVRWITSVDSDALWGDLANLVSANAALKGFSPE
jgi:inosine-uridine nucleoside N-ribohydrolase